MKLSVEMGLHKHSMDYIKVKSKNYIEQITRFKDTASSRNDSKSIMGGEMNKSAMTMINSGNSHVQLFNQPIAGLKGSVDSAKVKAIKEFLYTFDKGRVG